MRVLITGATGFIGKHLLTILKQSEHVSCAITRRAGTKISGADEYICVDISKKENLKKLPDDFDAVVHLGDGISSFEKQNKSAAYEDFGRAIQPTIDLAEWAIKKKIKHFIYISSVKAMCGEADENILTEASEVRPNSAYGQAKWQAERELNKLCNEQAIRLVILRNPIVHGPDSTSNISHLLKWADSPWPLPLNRKGSYRSTVSVQNFCDAIKTILDRPEKKGGTYLIADDGALSAGDIIDLFRQELGRKKRLFSLPSWIWNMANKFPGIRKISTRVSQPLVINDQQFRNNFSWSPLETTQQSLKQMAKRYNERQKIS